MPEEKDDVQVLERGDIYFLYRPRVEEIARGTRRRAAFLYRAQAG
jgi:hypothetical protein